MERYWQLALACKCSHNCTQSIKDVVQHRRDKTSTDPRIILSKRERQTKITKKIYLYLQASGQPASSRGHECWWRRQASRLLPLSMALSSILPYRSTVFSPSLQASNALNSFLLFPLSQRSPSLSLSLLTDLDLSQRTALILSLKEVERVFFFPGVATRLQKINRKKLDLTKESINQVRFYSINRSLSKIVFLSRNSWIRLLRYKKLRYHLNPPKCLSNCKK